MTQQQEADMIATLVHSGRGQEHIQRSIHAMLNPSSIAIVGATDRPGYGERFLGNLKKAGERVKLYPVNPNRTEVSGLPCYASVAELPSDIDMAAILVPSAHVLPAFRACIDKGVKSVMIVSAGFAELATEEGCARQAEVMRMARDSGVRVCGPNCLGLANVVSGIWANAATRFPTPLVGRQASIGVVSQSGATIYRILVGNARERGIPLRYLVATGNEADLESSDFIQYMLQDPEIRVVAAVVEGFKDGARLVQAADMALAAGKPIVLLKVGRTEAGSRAASSHTAAMTGSDMVQDALFSQKGIIRVDDYDELLETAAMLSVAQSPRGNRVGVLSESGGMASFMADKCAEEKLELPPLSEATRSNLTAVMGERGSAANPADLTSFATGPEFPTLLNALLEEEGQDILILSMGAGGVDVDAVIAAAGRNEKPVFFTWCSSRNEQRDQDALSRLQASGIPLFYLPTKAAKAARRLVEFHRLRRLVLAEKDLPDDQVQANGLPLLRGLVSALKHDVLGEYESKKALAAFGVPGVMEILCADRSEVVHAAEKLGYPVVLKIVSPQLLHKTEAGGVKLGLADAAAVLVAYDTMLSSVTSYAPHAQIDGVLVQRMTKGGVETIVGVSKDEQFGPVLMLGLGGVLAEAFGAATWRVCPINRREAQEMIGEVRGLARLLDGFRGAPKADADGLVNALIAVSRMAADAADDIESLDINPLVVLPEGNGAVALDALLVVKR